MGRGEPVGERLFEPEVAGFLAHISWRPDEGWRLWVTSYVEGQLPTSGHQDSYRRLTADEMLDVLAAEVETRCAWVRLDLPQVNGGGACAVSPPSAAR